MRRLLLVLIVLLLGAALWRRREIRHDAERASAALTGAADTARARLRPVGGGSPSATGDTSPATEAGSRSETDADEASTANSDPG